MPVTLTDLEQYSIQTDARTEHILTEKLIHEHPQKHTKALVIGRFQPLHRGHIFLIRCALLIAESVVICIGSANKTDSENPFSITIRKKLLYTVLARENITIENIIISYDNPDDTLWLKEIIEQVQSIDVIIGNNEWVNRIFSKAGYKTIEIPLLQRHMYEGTIIRDALRTEGKL